MSDEYDEIRQTCDEKIASAMRRVAELKEELAAALAQCDKLAMALKKYGEHNCDCIKYITDDKECDCGLDALLKECGK